MTEREPDRRRPPDPPSRPQFEFRGPPPSESEGPPRPPAVDVAFALWLAAAATGFVAAMLAMANLDELTAMFRAVLDRDFPGETAETRERVVDAAAAVLVGGLIVTAAGQAAFAVALRAGRGWARWMLLLVTGLGVLTVLFLLGVSPGAERTALLLSVVLAAIATILMFLPGSGAWFFARHR